MQKINQKKTEKIKNLIKKIIQNQKIPGITVGIVSGNDIIYSEGFGYKDVDELIPMTLNTYIGIGSVSKSFTVLGIMNLVNQNKIKLTDPVSKYIPYKLGFSDEPITIHHLLSHSSGVPELDGANYILDVIAKSTEKRISMSNFDDFLNHLNNAQSEVYYKPGEHYFYNNDHFACLALIIEKITGQSFAEYMKENIFLPLGLKNTTYLKSDPKNNNKLDIASFYIKNEDNELMKAQFPFSEILFGAGGVLSSTNDMLQYISLLLNPEQNQNQNIITQDVLNQIWKPVIELPYSTLKASYCYGFVSNPNFLGELLIEHGGNVIVSSSHIALIPKLNLGVYVGSNIGTNAVSEVGLSILSILIKGDEKAAFPYFDVYSKILNLCGSYESYKGLNTLKVEMENGILYMTIQIDVGKMKFPLVLSDSELLKFKICSIFSDKNMEIQFFISENKIYATYERYVFNKIDKK
ncbi:MAG: serine hydrolase [Promethearchaeota archaeon]